MAWIEEARERRLQEKEREKERALRDSEKYKLQTKHIEEFWINILNANESLPDDFRMKVENNKIINGKAIKLMIDGSSISAFSYADSKWVIFSVIYDTENQRLVGKQHKVSYEIDNNSIDSLLKNLCTGQNTVSGLQLGPEIIAANKKATIGCLIYLFIFLVIIAITAKSVEEFFNAIMGFILLMLIIAGITRLYRGY